jgi:hypothetical protein
VLAGYFPRYVVQTGSRQTVLSLNIPAGNWTARWWNPRTGERQREDSIDHPGGPLALDTPSYREDIALELRVR